MITKHTRLFNEKPTNSLRLLKKVQRPTGIHLWNINRQTLSEFVNKKCGNFEKIFTLDF